MKEQADMNVFLKILGITELSEEIGRLSRLVRNFRTEWRTEMATAREQVEAVNARLDDIKADVKALKDAAATSAENFSPEVQTAFDALVANVGGLDTEVGDADGSDTPAAPAPEDNGGDVPTSFR